MAKNRKGHYRAGHYVRPSSTSTKLKVPGWVLLVGVVVLIAGWNTLFGQ